MNPSSQTPARGDVDVLLAWLRDDHERGTSARGCVMAADEIERLRVELAAAVPAMREYAAEQCARWREILQRATADANRYGLEGLHMRCTPSETGQMLTWELTERPNVGVKA